MILDHANTFFQTFDHLMKFQLYNDSFAFYQNSCMQYESMISNLNRKLKLIFKTHNKTVSVLESKFIEYADKEGLTLLNQYQESFIVLIIKMIRIFLGI